ncbi:pentapeptide repeat-containing protein [Nocardioides sp. AE5]|uniref:pentapeptide repeat-containing protein n=1 Tax=Nocardioides sp. AE5 TaxID=2962573 RepID=UPI0028826F59|nr:pentapeptide repeat-containing protein [Nocardioides sp. AE5]MDT0200383.1 pentapeptide repeat-containing protein [Nocardioides sp. AE5]
MSRTVLARLAAPALLLGSLVLAQPSAHAADEVINGCTIVEFPTAAVHTDCGSGWSAEGASLTGKDLRWARMRGADLAGVDLSGADLTDAYLYEADLSGADLSGATAVDAEMRYTGLAGADLTNADLRRGNLFGTDLSGADLRGADLTDAELRGADLRDADVSEATLVGTSFYEATMSGADLSGADLRDAVLRFADLEEVDFTGADLTGARLEGASVTGSTLMPWDIEHTIPADDASAVITWAPTLPTGVQMTSCTPASGSVFPVGTHVVTCQYRANTTVGGRATGTFSITVDQAAPVEITSGAAPAGEVDVAYAHQVTVAGDPGLALYLSDGELPPGLVLDRDSGLISGTPAQAGTWTFTLRLTNDFGFDEQELTITIAAAPGNADDDGDDGDDGTGDTDDTTGGNTGDDNDTDENDTGGAEDNTAGGTGGMSPASSDQVLPDVGARADLSAAIVGLVLLGLGVLLLGRARRVTVPARGGRS